MADESTPSAPGSGEDDRWPDDQATSRNGGGYPAPGYGRGYGRDFGGGGRNQGFDGSHGEGYGAGLESGDYRSELGLGAAEGAQDEVVSFAARGEGFTSDHDGWSPGRDANDAFDAPRNPRGPHAAGSDAHLRQEIYGRLMADRLLDATGIVVEVEGGVVTLTGFVRRPSDLALASLLAQEAAAGADVRNRLALRPSSDLAEG